MFGKIRLSMYVIEVTDILKVVFLGIAALVATLCTVYGVFIIVFNNMDDPTMAAWFEHPFWRALYAWHYDSPNFNTMLNVVLFLSPFAFLPLSVFIWVQFGKELYGILEMHSSNKRLQKRRTDTANGLQETKRILNESKTLSKQAQYCVKFAQEKAEKIGKEARLAATPYLEKGRKLAQVLNDTFSTIIDCRDWENIDLILYALETRRADNMKEALAFVDGEKRANRIVNAVQQATITIRNSIQQASNRLANIMQNGITQLSNQLNSIERGVSGMRQEITSALETQNSQLSELCSKANMTNALLVKQNITSTRIAADVAAIRGTSDYFKDRLIHYPTY